MTKEFLSEKGIEYQDYDVSGDLQARDEMKKVSGGALAVPVICVGEEVMVGFDRDRLEKALEAENS